MNNEEITNGVAKLKEMHTAYWKEKKTPGNENKTVLQQTVGSFGADNDGKKLLIYLTKSVCGRALPDYTEKISYTNITETANSKSEEGKVPVKGYSRCYLMSKEEMDVSGISLYVTYNILEEKAYEFSIKLDLEGKASSQNCKDNLKSFKQFADNNCESKFEWEDRPDDLKIPKMVIDLSELENKPESINDVIKDMQDALIILKACYKYVLSGNSDILTKIVDLIGSMDRINDPDSPVALSTTMIAIDDLIFDDCKQIVLTGAPGTGKTYSAQEYIKWQLMTEYLKEPKKHSIQTFKEEWDKSENNEGALADRWRMVQFHPSYDYTDFVEGLRPIETKKEMQFKRMDGIFKEFCRKVAVENGNKDPKVCPKRFFLIDEINRADLSKVFGELMFCLEEDYRGKSHTIKTQYSNLDTYSKEGTRIKDDPKAGDVFENGFYIPENVIIIGTMNDIDRSVDTFDFALRRRFRWVNVEVNETLLTTTFLAMKKKNDSPKNEEEISGFVKSVMDMNSVFTEDQFKRIFKTPKDYYVGPAYFKGLFKNDTKDAIWRNKIEPLLREYVRGRDKAEDFINTCEGRFLGKKSGKVDSDVQDIVDAAFNENVTSLAGKTDSDIERIKNFIGSIAEMTKTCEGVFSRKNESRISGLISKLVSDKDLIDNMNDHETVAKKIVSYKVFGAFKDGGKERYKELLIEVMNKLSDDETVNEEQAEG